MRLEGLIAVWSSETSSIFPLRIDLISRDGVCSSISVTPQPGEIRFNVTVVATRASPSICSERYLNTITDTANNVDRFAGDKYFLYIRVYIYKCTKVEEIFVCMEIEHCVYMEQDEIGVLWEWRMRGKYTLKRSFDIYFYFFFYTQSNTY